MSKSEAVKRAAAVILLGAVALAVALCGQSCTVASGSDPLTGAKWTWAEAFTKRGTYMPSYRSAGSATVPLLGNILPSTPVRIDNGDGTFTEMTTADKARFFEEAESVVNQGAHPLVEVGPSGMVIRGTQDQVAIAETVGNAVTNYQVVRWAGKTFIAFIEEGFLTLRFLNR